MGIADPAPIRTPDQRLRVFVSSTLGELAEERAAARRAIERLRLIPVMFELGARPHPPRELYRAYLAQSDVFLGLYWQRYGWVAPGETVSGLEDEYRLAGGLPQLLYLKHPAPDQEPELRRLLDDVRGHDQTSYRRFRDPVELEELVAEDLAVLLSERFASSVRTGSGIRSTRARVPAPLTSIIGRESEVSQARGLLLDGCRLVTVTGPGGVGKTRLAQEVGRVLTSSHAGRRRPVHYVALAPVSDPRLVMATVADAVGALDSDRVGPVEAVADHLRPEPCLLVLDNLEQVVEARADIVRLLELAPELQVLATSRQALRVPGEHEMRLGPLPVPRQEEGAAALHAPSVRLFLERAGQSPGSADLLTSEASTVAELCRRLGGLPLAIELAAAGARLTGAAGVLARSDVLDLRSYGAEHPPRQRSLRATIEWSHDLLDEEERTVLARLSVFRGGATLEAVESVCAEPGLDVLAALAGLLDKSLVLVEHPVGAEPRVQLLETIRAYAAERLEERGGTGRLRDRHLDWMAGLGRRAQPFLCGPHQQDWVEKVDTERANLRAAVETALERDRPAVAVRLVFDTSVFFYVRDAMDEPRQWIARLGARRGDLDEVSRAVLDVLGALTVPDGQPPPCDDAALAEVSDRLARAGLPLESAVACHHRGVLRWSAGEPLAAAGILAGAREQYAAIGHEWGVTNVELALGALTTCRGTLPEAEEHFGEALLHARWIENRPQIALALQGLALVRCLAGRRAEAVAAIGESVALAVDDRMRTSIAYAVEVLAVMDGADGPDRRDRAVDRVHRARALRRSLGVPEWTAFADALRSASVKVGLEDPRLRADRSSALEDDPFDLVGAALRAVREAGGSTSPAAATRSVLVGPLDDRAPGGLEGEVEGDHRR